MNSLHWAATVLQIKLLALGFPLTRARDVLITQYRQELAILRETASAWACQFFRNLHRQKTADSFQ